MQFPYTPSPYGNSTLTTRSARPEVNNISTRLLYQNSPPNDYRWSLQPSYTHCESTAEDKKQMTDYGSGSSHPPGPRRRLSSAQATTTPLTQSLHQQPLPLFDRESPSGSLKQSASVVTPPPAMPEPPSAGTERRSGRSLESILNPSHGEATEHRGTRRSAGQMEESGGEGSSSVTTDPLTRPTSSGGSGTGGTSPTGQQRPRSAVNRRILTPVPRTASGGRIVAGNINTPTGTINAQQSPFVSTSSSRYRTIDPGSSGIPPLSVPPAAQTTVHRAGLSVQVVPTAPLPQPKRGSSSIISSTTASSSPSYSPYGASGQLSPAISYTPSSGATPPGSSGLAHSPIARSLGAVPSMQLDLEQSTAIPVVSTGQSSYQLMAIPTGKGTVQIPVEMQAASRMADEKRKRNAGASARFRARRKEKEREASTKIAILESQLRDAGEEIEWYKKERQDLLIALQTLPGGDRYLTREKSPRTRRQEGARPPTTPGTQRSYTFDRVGLSETEMSNRRKIDTLSLPPPPGSDSVHSPYPSAHYPVPFAQPHQSATFPPRTFGDLSQYPRDQPYERDWPSRTAPPR